MLSARYLGFWGWGLGGFGIWCSLRVTNAAISLATSLLSHHTCVWFSISPFYSFPRNLRLEDLTLCFFCFAFLELALYFCVFRALKSVFRCKTQEPILRFLAGILYSLSPVDVCSFILLWLSLVVQTGRDSILTHACWAATTLCCRENAVYCGGKDQPLFNPGQSWAGAENCNP